MLPGSFQRVVIVAWQRWFIVALCVLLLVLSVQYSLKVTGYYRGAPGSAFERWRGQILHLSDEDIYERYNYPNPPIMALLLEPLAELPPLAGSLCWFYIKVAMTLTAIFWVFRIVEVPGKPFPAVAKAISHGDSRYPPIGSADLFPQFSFGVSAGRCVELIRFLRQLSGAAHS